MTASNHFIVGSLIGATIANPLLAVPVAIGSHFVLDSLPQYGYEGDVESRRFGFGLFQWVLALDIMMFAVTIISLTFILHEPYLIFYGLAGYSPDLMWIYRYTVTEKIGSGKRVPFNWLEKFHVGVQHLESPWGLLVEVPFFLLCLYSLVMITG